MRRLLTVKYRKVNKKKCLARTIRITETYEVSQCGVCKRNYEVYCQPLRIKYTQHVYGRRIYIPVACRVHAIGFLRDNQTRRLFRTHLSAVRDGFRCRWRYYTIAK